VAYTFDYGNRLREVAGQENYFYDAYGRRVQATASANGQSILSMYTRDGRLIYQDDQRASAKHDYLYLGRQLVEVVDHGYGGGNAMRYQHADAQGSIVAQTNATPGIIERTAYSSWGAPLNHDNDDEPGYTGQLQDSLTGLTYMQQRYYDPEAGRFLSVDPVDVDSSSGANFNRYWYANDNPYRFTDPDGRCAGSLLSNCSFSTSPATIILVATGGAAGSRAKAQRQSASSSQSIESAAQQPQDEGRTLTQGESDDAHSELPDLNTDLIRIKYDLRGNTAYTPNNTMHFPRSMSWCRDFSTCDNGAQAGWFIHEVTHVWQYQHGRSPFWGHIFSKDILSTGNYLPLSKYIKTPSPVDLSTEKQADWHMWHFVCTHDASLGC
jgi:RHS repeat-associated protein